MQDKLRIERKKVMRLSQKCKTNVAIKSHKIKKSCEMNQNHEKMLPDKVRFARKMSQDEVKPVNKVAR